MRATRRSPICAERGLSTLQRTENKPEMHQIQNDERPPISCYIRTKNEERLIARTIEAALKVAREVVIVDSGSNDGTIELAEGLGAKVVHQSWLGSGLQKRVGEDNCLYDLVLDLDADEIVSPELAQEISMRFYERTLGSINSLRLVTVPPSGEPWMHHAIARRNKLYDRRVIRAPEHEAWDQFKVPKDVAVRCLEAPLFHHSYRDLTQFVEKLNRVSAVRARQGTRRGKLGAGLRVLFAFPFYFLKHYFQRGHYKDGVYGFIISMSSAFGRWMRDAKTYEDWLVAKARGGSDKDA
jgi:glycosyltransferase involved in cell wall biosynthesis